MISIFRDLLDRQRRIVIRNLPPLRMTLEILRTLGERLRVGVYGLDILQLRPRQSDQRMLTLYDLLPDDIIFKIHEQVVVIRDDTRRRIFNRQHRIVRRAFRNRLHRIPECPYMEAVHIVAEISPHRRMAVRTLNALVHDPDIFPVDIIHLDKWQAPRGTILLKQLILQLPAHRHDLLKELLDPVPVKIIVCHRLQLCQLFMLTLFVKYFLSIRDLVTRHFGTHTHPLLKQLYHLLINFVNFLTQFY